MILAGDTGGTKTLLALHERAGETGALGLIHERGFACADFPSLEAVVEAFLAEPAAAGARIEAACFGVAGPVVGGSAKITNLPWTIDASALSQLLGGVPVSLLNDLQATALGMLELPESSLAVVQPGSTSTDQRRHATIGVIAPGTGLGASMLVAIDGRYHALPTEAGQADFAPQSEEEMDFARYLRDLHGPHVSVERALSGDGLGDLYGFQRQRSGVPEPAWLTQRLAAERNAAISAVALEGQDPACVRALEMFVELLGAEAGNLALRCLAHGGVIIGGGISPKILPALTTGRLVERFRAKGRFSAWLSTLPLKISIEPQAALIGAAYRAARDAG